MWIKIQKLKMWIKWKILGFQDVDKMEKSRMDLWIKRKIWKFKMWIKWENLRLKIWIKWKNLENKTVDKIKKQEDCACLKSV